MKRDRPWWRFERGDMPRLAVIFESLCKPISGTSEAIFHILDAILARKIDAAFKAVVAKVK